MMRAYDLIAAAWNWLKEPLVQVLVFVPAFWLLTLLALRA